MLRPMRAGSVLVAVGLMLTTGGCVGRGPVDVPAHGWYFESLEGDTIKDLCASADGVLIGEYDGHVGERRPGYLHLDGDGDYVRVDHDLYRREPMTVMGWAETFRLGGTQTLVDITGRGGAGARIALGVDFIGNAHVWVTCGETTYFWDERLPINRRTHLAAACTPTSVSLYMDGQDMGPHNGHPVAAPPLEVEGTAFIGRGNLAGEETNEFCGVIDHVALYKTLLSADEVALAMHAAKAEGYVDFFENGAGPTEHWDGFDGNGFSEQRSALEGNGFRGPHEFMATVPTTDHEISFWYRYTDQRKRADIRAGEQSIRFSLRRGLRGSADLYLEIAPEAFTVRECTDGTTKGIATNDQVKSEPNVWYSVRMRVLGDAVRVWRRADDGS